MTVNAVWSPGDGERHGDRADVYPHAIFTLLLLDAALKRNPGILSVLKRRIKRTTNVNIELWKSNQREKQQQQLEESSFKIAGRFVPLSTARTHFTLLIK